MPVMCAALAVLGLPRNLLTLMVAFGGLGVVSGLLDVAINTQAVAIERGYRRPLMSGIHGIWSAGMLAGSAVGAGAAGMGTPPFVHFSFVALLLLTVSSWTMRGLLPANAEEFRPLVAHGSDPGRAVGSASVLALCVIGFSSLFGEGAAADWSAVYLHDELGAAPGVAGLAFVSFSLGMTVARFLGDGLSSRYGSPRVVASGGLLAAASLSLGLLIPEWPVALASFAFLGFALGPIAPTVFSRAGNTWVGGKGTALQLTVTVSYVGSIMGPILIGLIAERLDLRLALGLPAALGLVIAAAAPALAGGDVTTGEGRPRVPAPRR
jgi:fucose permease